MTGPSGGWSVVPSPNTGSPHNYLVGVAAIAPNDVWAVGGYGIEGDRAWQQRQSTGNDSQIQDQRELRM